MRYLKKFENKEESTFDVDTYLDYLLSEVREDHIMHKDLTTLSYIRTKLIT